MGTKKDLETDGETLVADEIKISEPKLYKVMLLNDDYTTMDFVVSVLETIFSKSPSEAVKVMMSVHKNGSGLCGIYPKQIAEAKIQQVHIKAQTKNYPLRCQMEEA